jgi:hypothetical protein
VGLLLRLCRKQEQQTITLKPALDESDFLTVYALESEYLPFAKSLWTPMLLTKRLVQRRPSARLNSVQTPNRMSTMC